MSLAFASNAALAAPPAASVEIVRRDEPIRQRPDVKSPRRGAAIRGARLPFHGSAPGPGCATDWYSVGPIAWVCGEGAVPTRLPASALPRHPSEGGLPFPYYFVGRDGSLGYRDLSTAEEGVPEAQFLPGFGVAVTRLGNKPGAFDPFGLTTHGLWVPLRDLGGPVKPPEPLASESIADSAWVNVEHAAVLDRPRGKKLRTLPGSSHVTVLERRELGRDAWLRIGDAEWIRARDATTARTAAPPPEALPDERWLDVDLERQMLTAYRGETPLFAMPVSTGRGPKGTELETPRGTHRLWIKLSTTDMDNLENLEAKESYAIQSVPWVMFFDRGYGLHGAFWHRAFGRVQSHGCVNLTPSDAERLFSFTSPRLPDGWSAVFPTDYERGTIVRVR
jgi:hypothetical protein